MPRRKSKTLNRKRVYTVRDLSVDNHKSFSEFLLDIEKNNEALDKLKKPDEFWAARVYGARTWIPYENIDLLAAKLRTYDAVGKAPLRELIKNIQIIKFKGHPSAYKQEKKAEVEKRIAETKELKATVKELKLSNKQKDVLIQKLSARLEAKSKGIKTKKVKLSTIKKAAKKKTAKKSNTVTRTKNKRGKRK